MTTTIDLSADYIDVSELTDRVDELEADQPLDSDDDLAELDALKAVLNKLKGYGGDHQWDGSWYPAQLIHERAFESAMDELLEDIGDIPRDLPSYLSITVDYVALQQDYSGIEIDGESYLYR